MQEELSVEVQSPAQINGSRSKSKFISMISLILAVVSVAGIISMWYVFTSKITDLENRHAREIAAIQDSNSQSIKELGEIRQAFFTIKDVVFLNAAAREIEDATVTDDFIVDKVYFSPGESDNLAQVVIDVDNQPELSYSYKGKGAYDLSDREIRAKCESIIKEVAASYKALNSSPIWDDQTKVILTVKNYEIGNMEKGKFTLVGETK